MHTFLTHVDPVTSFKSAVLQYFGFSGLFNEGPAPLPFYELAQASSSAQYYLYTRTIQILSHLIMR